MKIVYPLKARSASVKTDDWPYWFVADATGLNVTVEFAPERAGRLPFLPKEAACDLADAMNDRHANGIPYQAHPSPFQIVFEELGREIRASQAAAIAKFGLN